MDPINAGYYTLESKTNKVHGKDIENEDGVSQNLIPELGSVDISDADLLEKTNTWENLWKSSRVFQEFKAAGDESEKYWLGKHYGKAEMEANRAVVDNVLFEALETFLPVATKRNPEPLVTFVHKADEQVYGNIKTYIKERLDYLAKKLSIRLKVQKAARHWALFLLGCAYIGWDLAEDEISVEVIKPHALILDPDSVTDEDGYHGEFIGRYRKISAERLIELSPKHKEFITNEVNEKLGTKLTIKEWFTDTYVCWTYKDQVFLKARNPNWNYDTTVYDNKIDDYGAEVVVEKQKKGINLFKHPKKPFVLLSIYNLGDRPVDKTSLILQNLSNQDSINKRNKQIDRNVDHINNGMIVSLANSGLTKEQAKNVTDALRRGGVVMIPSGSPSDAIQKVRAESLAPDVYTMLNDRRNSLRSIFGVQGISSAGIQNEDSVRGKLVIKGLDTDRIGGSISDNLDKFAGEIFRWMVQMMLVYYDKDPIISSLQELPEIDIESKEGSMLPNDTASEATQAIQLAGMGLMSPIDLFTKLEYPNPIQMATDLFLWQNDPTSLLQDDPRIQMFKQQQAEAQSSQENMMQEKIRAEDQRSKEELDKTLEGEEKDRKIELIKILSNQKNQNKEAVEEE